MQKNKKAIPAEPIVTQLSVGICFCYWSPCRNMHHLLAEINMCVARIVLFSSGLRGFAPSRGVLNFTRGREGHEDATIESHAILATTKTSTKYCITTAEPFMQKNN